RSFRERAGRPVGVDDDDRLPPVDRPAARGLLPVAADGGGERTDREAGDDPHDLVGQEGDGSDLHPIGGPVRGETGDGGARHSEEGARAAEEEVAGPAHRRPRASRFKTRTTSPSTEASPTTKPPSPTTTAPGGTSTTPKAAAVESPTVSLAS